MTTTVDTNAITGEVTIRDWTEEEVIARIVRLTPLQWSSLRSQRNNLLDKSDSHVLPDRWANYTTEQQLAWTIYRQALRDLPENTTDPFNPVWPVMPT